MEQIIIYTYYACWVVVAILALAAFLTLAPLFDTDPDINRVGQFNSLQIYRVLGKLLTPHLFDGPLQKYAWRFWGFVAAILILSIAIIFWGASCFDFYVDAYICM